jgi:LmbE family N-acetylglucosaminyl deacetylase
MSTLLIVHAHPDDEVFGTGGTIARYSRTGHRVVVVYATGGEAGEMFHPEIDEDEGRKRLGELRQLEAREACRVLGTEDVYFLGYRDSGMRDTEENKHPGAFMNAELDEAAGRLLDVMRATQPDVVVTYDESGGYGHPDHVRTHEVALEAFDRARQEPGGPKKLYYSTRSRRDFRRYAEAASEFGLKIPWLPDDFNFDEYGLPDEDITAYIDISDFAPLKKRALAVHKTQIKPDFFYLSMPDEAMKKLQGAEFFVRAYPPHKRGEREDDLFAGVPEAEGAALRS